MPKLNSFLCDIIKHTFLEEVGRELGLTYEETLSMEYSNELCVALLNKTKGDMR